MPSEVVYSAVAVRGTEYDLIPGAGQSELFDAFISEANGGASTEAGAASVTASWLNCEGNYAAEVTASYLWVMRYFAKWARCCGILPGWAISFVGLALLRRIAGTIGSKLK